MKKIVDMVCMGNLDSPKYCVLILPGRGGLGEILCKHYSTITELENTIFVGVTPEFQYWYPMPFSATHQDDAVEGLEPARLAIENVVSKIINEYYIPKNKIALSGFSAGGVMALYTATNSEEPYAAVLSHSGAYLVPEDIPECICNTPIVLFHNRDDTCFDWYERYLPMKYAFLEKNYKLYTLEKENGGHSICPEDLVSAGIFISRRLRHRKSWRHSKFSYINDRISSCIA